MFCLALPSCGPGRVVVPSHACQADAMQHNLTTMKHTQLLTSAHEHDIPCLKMKRLEQNMTFLQEVITLAAAQLVIQRCLRSFIWLKKTLIICHLILTRLGPASVRSNLLPTWSVWW
jgi:hypothetical protein